MDVALQPAALGVLGLDHPCRVSSRARGFAPGARGDGPPARPAVPPASARDRPGTASSVNKRSSTTVSGSPGRSCSRSTPSTWSPYRTGEVRRPSAPAAVAAGNPGTGGALSSFASSGHRPAKVKRPDAWSQTCAHCAPVPCASNRDMRAGRSSVTSSLSRVSANRARTSYGVAIAAGGSPFEPRLYRSERERDHGRRQHRQGRAG